jgi:hypothetical protein
MSLREWVPTLIMGPMAVAGIAALFWLRADRQDDVLQALCRQDVNAARAEVLQFHEETGKLTADTTDFSWQGPVLAEISVELDPDGQDFSVYGACDIEGTTETFRATMTRTAYPY